jgi:hypothetical protein
MKILLKLPSAGDMIDDTVKKYLKEESVRKKSVSQTKKGYIQKRDTYKN